MGLFGSDPAKKAAKEARKAEEKRQADIRSGVQQINEIFYGGPVYEERPVEQAAGGQAPVGRWGGRPPGGAQAGYGGSLGDMLSQRRGGPMGPQRRSIMEGITTDFQGRPIGGRGFGGFRGAPSGPQTERVQVGTRGGFDDDFYGDIQKSYEDYYMPQLEEQYGAAKTDLKSILSGQGILSSSAGQRRFSDMLKDYEEGRRQITNRGMGRAQQARGQMEDIRSDLIGQLEGGMGLGSVTDIARAKAASLGAAPQYDPLADMFQTGTGVLANAAAAERAGRRGMGGAATSSMSPFRGGSARVY